MCERIKKLPDINKKLYIYAAQSGILAITTDLSKSYYSVYLDGIEPKQIGLFVAAYPKTEEDFKNVEKAIKEGTLSVYADDTALTALKSFEIVSEKESTIGMEMNYALYRGMSQRLLKIIEGVISDPKPFTKYISIISDGKYAELASTDRRTLCVFKNIPITTEHDETVRYLLPKDMVEASLNIESPTIAIVKIEDKNKRDGEYRIQLICGDYLFVEKQYIVIYPIYGVITQFYSSRMHLPLVLCPAHLESIKTMMPYKVDDEYTLISLTSLMNILCSEPDITTSDAVFNKAYVERVFNCLASPNYTICTGSNREQLQVSCRWGKTQEYSQTICVMPINPDTLKVKEIIQDMNKIDEPVSSCNIKSIKNLI